MSYLDVNTKSGEKILTIKERMELLKSKSSSDVSSTPMSTNTTKKPTTPSTGTSANMQSKVSTNVLKPTTTTAPISKGPIDKPIITPSTPIVNQTSNVRSVALDFSKGRQEASAPIIEPKTNSASTASQPATVKFTSPPPPALNLSNVLAPNQIKAPSENSSARPNSARVLVEKLAQAQRSKMVNGKTPTGKTLLSGTIPVSATNNKSQDTSRSSSFHDTTAGSQVLSDIAAEALESIPKPETVSPVKPSIAGDIKPEAVVAATATKTVVEPTEKVSIADRISKFSSSKPVSNATVPKAKVVPTPSTTVPTTVPTIVSTTVPKTTLSVNTEAASQFTAQKLAMAPVNEQFSPPPTYDVVSNIRVPGLAIPLDSLSPESSTKSFLDTGRALLSSSKTKLTETEEVSLTPEELFDSLIERLLGPDPNLTEVVFSRNSVLLERIDAFSLLASSLKHNPHVTKIELNKVGMKDEHIEEFCIAWSSCKNLSYLSIESNNLSNVGIEKVAHMAETHPSLSEIKLANQYGLVGAVAEKALANALSQNPNIRKIGFNFNEKFVAQCVDQFIQRNIDRVRKARHYDQSPATSPEPRGSLSPFRRPLYPYPQLSKASASLENAEGSAVVGTVITESTLEPLPTSTSDTANLTVKQRMELLKSTSGSNDAPAVIVPAAAPKSQTASPVRVGFQAAKNDFQLLCDRLESNDPKFTELVFNSSTLISQKEGNFERLAALVTNNKYITSIELNNVNMKDSHLPLLCTAWSSCTSLHKLSVETNSISSKGIALIAEMMEHHPSLVELRVANQRVSVGVEAERALANALSHNRHVTKLSFAFREKFVQSYVDQFIQRNIDRQRKLRTSDPRDLAADSFAPPDYPFPDNKMTPVDQDVGVRSRSASDVTEIKSNVPSPEKVKAKEIDATVPIINTDDQNTSKLSVAERLELLKNKSKAVFSTPAVIPEEEQMNMTLKERTDYLLREKDKKATVIPESEKVNITDRVTALQSTTAQGPASTTVSPKTTSGVKSKIASLGANIRMDALGPGSKLPPHLLSKLHSSGSSVSFSGEAVHDLSLTFVKPSNGSSAGGASGIRIGQSSDTLSSVTPGAIKHVR